MTKLLLVTAALTGTFSLAPTAFADGEQGASSNTITMMPAPMAATATATPSVPATERANVFTVGLLSADAGGGHDHAGFAFEISHRMPDSRVHIHGELALGVMASQPDVAYGDFTQLRAGIEARGQGETVRLVGGIDLGYLRETIGEGTSHMRLDESFMSVPRVGLEVGDRLRGRATLEVPLVWTDARTDAGLGFTLAAGVGF